ncbi:type II CRISPR-associated endonuclease Cas1 [Ancylomarina euxinus]|uniref:CRISPR-associated endonuclease Cas1 n=1 Tax=Ancylomarina euxinus TaxID=2283627 RepID=A0A425Y428_9BACT|nr:type II CRISPR-associated endonuclease Cas1 [Ancylomarina euxinus]MCZ4694461.1 type II CRISPR-associated endonuclease Cas1 [Ancylomarina euxinus]MUP14004.1 type II CRISPR-associated endonuclease Cas1 [Ancylomarina euxinus]RRG22866.1 type II CRISPR-associated endonuclease Cas1 [Ancylomarina euxinus]
MIKRTLYFGNPAYLRRQDGQLKVLLPKEKTELASIPIEDIGVMVLDHPQVTLSQALLSYLISSNVALISCNEKHHPVGLFLPLDGNSVQSERFKVQLDASEPLKKQLWAQTVGAKVENQARLLERFGLDAKRLHVLIPQIKSGDSENVEARAAKIYWGALFENHDFVRERFGDVPNPQLNYAYAIMRACVARALVSSGLLPTLGIFHRNKYNAYCLADDIMEPYRPYCDEVVMQMFYDGELEDDKLTKEQKAKILSVLTTDVVFTGKKSPLMVGISRTTSSLYECFAGERRKIVYPEFYDTVCTQSIP